MRSVQSAGVLSTALFLAGFGALRGQTVISAQSGLIHHVRGEVLVDGQPFDGQTAGFRLLKGGSELRTGRGRAEIILHPGELPYLAPDFIPAMADGDSPVFKPGATLRLGGEGALRMLDNGLLSPRFELLAGSALLDLGSLPRGTAVYGVMAGAAVRVSKSGLYRFDVHPARVSVYKGEAMVESGGRRTRLAAGMRLPLDAFKAEPFDTKSADALDRWSRWRARVISQSNFAAMKRLIRPPPPQRRRLR